MLNLNCWESIEQFSTMKNYKNKHQASRCTSCDALKAAFKEHMLKFKYIRQYQAVEAD